MRPFCTRVKQSEAHVLMGCNVIASQALIQQLYYLYFILLLNYRAIFNTSAEQSEAHVLEGCIKNCSICSHTIFRILAHYGCTLQHYSYMI